MNDPVEPNLSGIQPEGHQIVRQAAQVFQGHLGTWLVSLVAHGSVVKGGFIPGGSDVDLVLFVEPGMLTNHGTLSVEMAIAIHRDLAAIDTKPFRYLQSHVQAPGVMLGPGFISGAYHIVLGDPDIPLATADELRRSAQTALDQLAPDVVEARVSNHLLDRGEGRLYRELRFLCTDVWPMLYHVVTLHTGDPLGAWRLPKPEAIAAVSETGELGRAIRAFHGALIDHYVGGETAESALHCLCLGLEYLYAAKNWYHEPNTKR